MSSLCRGGHSYIDRHGSVGGGKRRCCCGNESFEIERVAVGDNLKRLIDSEIGIEELQLDQTTAPKRCNSTWVNLVRVLGGPISLNLDRDRIGFAVVVSSHFNHSEMS